MKTHLRPLLVAAVFFAGSLNAAVAGPCDAYFSFDNTLADAGGNGYDGEMFGARGTPAKPNYAQGRSGEALRLDGAAGMQAPLHLNYNACPQMTISAWVRVEHDAPSQIIQLFSTGGGARPGMWISGSSLTLNGTENGITVPNAILPGLWTFVAGVYDYATGDYRLYYGARDPIPGVLSERRGEPFNAFWVGAVHHNTNVFPSGVLVDDLRITGEALDKNAVEDLWLREPDTVSAESNLAAETGPLHCSSNADCGTDSYCAVDGACYPRSQLPKDYTAGGDSLPIPTNPNADHAGLIPDLDAGESGPTTVIGPFSDGLAGRWQYHGGQDGASMFMSVEFRGPDSSLAGHVWLVGGSMLGTIRQDEPMTSVTYTGNNIRFSTQNIGDFAGTVSEDGSRITSTEGFIVLERVSSASVHNLGADDSDLLRVFEGTWIHDDMICPLIGGCSGSVTVLNFWRENSQLSGSRYGFARAMGHTISDESEPLTDIELGSNSVSFRYGLGGRRTGTLSDDKTELTFPSADPSSSGVVYVKQ
jgi:hypothetical protein